MERPERSDFLGQKDKAGKATSQPKAKDMTGMQTWLLCGPALNHAFVVDRVYSGKVDVVDCCLLRIGGWGFFFWIR